MRTIPTCLLLAIACAASACGGMDYKDSNAAVDANPLCASRPDQPNEPVSKDCERKAEVNWSSGRDKSDEPIDFGKNKD